MGKSSATSNFLEKSQKFDIYQKDLLQRKLGLVRKDSIQEQLKAAGFQASKDAAEEAE